MSCAPAMSGVTIVNGACKQDSIEARGGAYRGTYRKNHLGLRLREAIRAVSDARRRGGDLHRRRNAWDPRRIRGRHSAGRRSRPLALGRGAQAAASGECGPKSMASTPCARRARCQPARSRLMPAPTVRSWSARRWTRTNIRSATRRGRARTAIS
jgi:hypothetical protein